MIPKIKILFVGGGNMTQAIIAGLIAQGCIPENIFVVDRHSEKCAALRARYQVQTSLTMATVVSKADVIFLAIKPQGAKIACEALRPLIATRNPLIISVMVGITIGTLQLWLNDDLPIVRTMPNTPVVLQKGATGMFALSDLSEAHKKMAETLMGAVGITAWLAKESDINIINALSGSGPAYYFYFVELMRNIAIEMGLTADIAAMFAAQTIYGAAALVHQGQHDVVELRQQVTSKKGTTEAAIQVMEANDLESILRQAMQACATRALALSEAVR